MVCTNPIRIAHMPTIPAYKLVPPGNSSDRPTHIADKAREL
ncbi:hypothetical protein MFUM_700104 [Methylacidiphilum fumariolicum SolV]|uniref:Uncharacterized protein n=1 Tax=Methylacidiphilum fumariolicum (strain SolV) TaxID=1156937 RepID=I0JZ84_METFB|nr:hypothetical protein MFUM_700104 [Methylacidiphilum fumariolicum SolV]